LYDGVTKVKYGICGVTKVEFVPTTIGTAPIDLGKLHFGEIIITRDYSRVRDWLTDDGVKWHKTTLVPVEEV